MSRISTCFQSLRDNGKKALIPFITAGDPMPEMTVQLMHAMVTAGANLIELGVPFSDPMADGPAIQRASERALKYNVSLRDVLNMVSQFRTTDMNTPVILMGYVNPIEIMGYEIFADAASSVGVDGVLTVDLPPEEASSLVHVLEGTRIDPIFLVAPTTTNTRIEKICKMARGFVYYVSLKGVTGAANLDVGAVADKLNIIRRISNLPIAVGFGIKDKQSAQLVANVADAVIVGSALVKKIEALYDRPNEAQQEIVSLLHDMRIAIDAKLV